MTIPFSPPLPPRSLSFASSSCICGAEGDFSLGASSNLIDALRVFISSCMLIVCILRGYALECGRELDTEIR